MLAGSELDADRFASYYFGRTAPLAGGCTMMAATPESTASGTTLVGRNYDGAYADRRWCEARLIAPDGEPARVGYTHHWGGLCDAMNDSGLAVCIASLPPVGTHQPGMQWHLVVDLVATRCRTAHEAVETIAAVPHLRSIAYMVADATNAFLVEADPTGHTLAA